VQNEVTSKNVLARHLLGRGAKIFRKALWELEALGFRVVENGREFSASFAPKLASGYPVDEVLEQAIMESQLSCDCSFGAPQLEQCPRCAASDYVMSAWLAFERRQGEKHEDRTTS
jgi:hypothetical protein